MKETEIVEVLPDGTIHCFDTDVCQQEADNALEILFQKEGKQLKFDYTSTIYYLFVQCIHTLSDSGWNTEELIAEVIEHSEADDRDNFIGELGDD